MTFVTAALTSPSNGRGGSYRLDDHDVHGNHLVAKGYTHSGGETYRESETVGALTQQSASESSAMTPLVAVPAYALGSHAGSDGEATNSSHEKGASVRRLTPTECERLQALPDGWTDPGGRSADSRRYAGLGDAVTATVGEWVGRRILEAS